MSSEMWMMSPTESDHDVILTLPGKVETLRPAIAKAVERLNYKVIGEQSIYARRSARRSASWACSIETLDYPRKLTVALKQVNDVSTLATFSFEIKAYSGLTRGDRRTLECEARAIAAVAMQHGSATSCSACGTTVTDDSRFCRKCGALVVVEVAELEVLRLMEDSRRGYHNVTIGAVLSFIALLLSLFLIWVDTAKTFKVVTLLSLVTGLIGVLTLLHGIWQVHRALNPVGKGKALTDAPMSFAAPQTSALPPGTPQLSVTEGTTELLLPEVEQREGVPLKRKAVDTAEVR